ncbi:MAG: glycerol-3-phosphate dehydrogenase [Oscillospiraceae bacterium]|nr:glycerol-3-phosphate dehydrogenase [Oscillospiraceae bacterium]
MAIITVIGSGAMGSAMSVPARTNGHTVRLVGTMLDVDIINHAKETGYHTGLKRTLPSGIEYFQLEELETALTDVDLIISGVSSFGVKWFASEIMPRLPKNIPVLSITKGMLNQSDGYMISFPKYYEGLYPDMDFLAVGGPCTSYELVDLDNTCVGICGNNPVSLEFCKDLLATSYYHINLTTDIEGFEFAVALKNAYAMAVTLALGLSLKDGDVLHYNSQAALFGQSVREMRKLLIMFGYNGDNLEYGVGDLYVTVFGGRTRKIGTLLGMGHNLEYALNELSGITLESVVIAERTSKAVLTFIDSGRAKKEDYPLLLHVYNIIANNAPVDIPWSEF